MMLPSVVQRHIVIGDIHGCFTELQQLLSQVHARDEDIIVSVGDLVDRGPDSVRVVDFFREQPSNRIAIVGNHERKHIRGIFSYAQEITRLQFADAYDDAVEWMRTLPYFLELPDAIVVHAALVPDRPLAEQHQEVLCGSTSGERELASILGEGWWHERYRGPKPVIFGHHVVDEPLLRDGLIYGIDTGACHGGHLTAVTLPDFRLHSVPSRSDHWTHAKRAWQADVLASKPWETLSWTELTEQLARFHDVEDDRSKEFIASFEAWRARVDALVDNVLSALLREAAATDPESMRKHPLAKFYFQAARGRLDRAALLEQVHTASALSDVATVLGLAPIATPQVRPRAAP